MVSRDSKEAWIEFWKGRRKNPPFNDSLKYCYNEFRAADGRIFLLNPYSSNNYPREGGNNSNCDREFEADSSATSTCENNPRTANDSNESDYIVQEATNCEFSKVGADRMEEIKSEEMFWNYYLRSMTDYIIYIHVINIIMLVIVFVFFAQYPFTGDRQLYHDLCIDISFWILISVACAWALLEFQYSYKFSGLMSFVSLNATNAIKLWRSIGFFVVGTRILCLLRDILKSEIASLYFGMNAEYSHCRLPERLEDVNVPTAVEVIILRSSLEISQMGMFSIVPFPNHLILWMSLSEFFIQFRRLDGCSSLAFAYASTISSEYETLYKEFTSYFIFSLLCFYIFVGLSSYSILNSSKSTYLSMEKAKASAQKIKSFIKFLCNEIRLPLQMMSRFIDIDKVRSINDKTIYNLIESDVNIILGRLSLLTSSLVLLSKIDENFQIFHSTHLINIQRLFNAALLRHCSSFDDISQYLDVYFEQTEIHSNHTVLSTIMDNLLYFAEVYLEDMMIGDKGAIQPNSILITFCVEEEPTKNGCIYSQYLLRIKVVSKNVVATKTIDDMTSKFTLAEDKSSTKRIGEHIATCTPHSVQDGGKKDIPEMERNRGNESHKEMRDNARRLGNSNLGSANIFQTVLMSCKTIAENHGGNFNISASEVDFSLIVYMHSDNILTGPNECIIVSMFNVALLARDLLSNDNLKRTAETIGFKPTAVIFCDQTSVVLNDTMDSLLFYDLIFISDISLLKCLKRHTSSRIVLIGNVETDINMYDYNLHLPLSPKSIEEFKLWCKKGGDANLLASKPCKTTEQTIRGLGHANQDSLSILTKMISFFSSFLMRKPVVRSTQAKYDSRHPISKQGRNFDFFNQRVGMPLFLNSVEENFLKWRIFNPVHSFFHRSMSIDIAIGFCLAYYYSTSISTTGASFYLFSSYILTFFCLVLSLRTRIYPFIDKYGFSLNFMWFCLMFIIFVFFVGSVILIYIDVYALKAKVNAVLYGSTSTEGKIFNFRSFSDREEVLNLTTTSLDSGQIFGSNSFTKCMIIPLGTIELVTFWALHVPWPMGYFFNFSLILRFLSFNFYVLPFFADFQFYFSLFMVCSMFFALNAFVLYHFELSTRLEFQTFRKTSYNTKYMELIQNLCQKDLLLTLNQLNRNKYSHSKIVFDSAFVSDELIHMIKNTNRVELFFLGHTLIDALLFMMKKKTKNDMNISNKNMADTAKVALTDYNLDMQDNLQILLLKSELQDHCRKIKLYCSTLNMQVDISLSVDSSLGIITASKEKIQSMVMLCLLQAVQNLLESYRVEKGDTVKISEISVRAEAVSQSAGASRRFTETRKMRIIVDDTGISSDSNSNMKNAFPSGEFSVKYEERKNSVFKCRQVITIDYRTSIVSNSAAQFLDDDDGDECIYLIKNKKEKMCKFYDDWYHLCFKKNLALDLNNETNIKRKLSILLIEPHKKNVSGLKGLFEMFGWSITTVTSTSVALYKPKILEVDCILIDYNNSLEENNGDDSEHGYKIDDLTSLRLLGYESTVIAIVDDVALTLQGQKSDRSIVSSSTATKHVSFLSDFHGIVGRPVGKATLMEIDQICLKSKLAALVSHDATMHSFF